MLRFMEYVKKHIGVTDRDITSYFDSDIEKMANECHINWNDTKNNLIGGKNKYPAVVGKDKEDKGRVHVWVEYERTKVIDGESFNYQTFAFKNYRNSLDKIGKKFNCLTAAFEAYEKYKVSGIVPVKKAKTKQPDNRAELTEKANLTLIKNEKIRLKEERLFNNMLYLKDENRFSPYMKEKGVEDIIKQLGLDIRVGKNYLGYFTALDFYNNENTFGGLQRIYNKPINEDGDRKLTSTGFNPMGFYRLLGADSLVDQEIVYICEGVATALSILAATGKPVIICLFADNIVPVSKAIKEINPNIVRVHVADNDNKTPKSGNAGVYQCARAVKMHGGWVFVPKVINGTDANDLHVTEGVNELQQQIKCKLNYFNGNFSSQVEGQFNYIFNKAA